MSNERIDRIERNMESAGIDWSRFDIEEAVRGLNEEEREKRLGEISMIMELQGKINELKITLEMIIRQREEEERRRKEDREQKRREREEEDDRKCRKSYERNEREREEKEERRRIDNKWRNIEKIGIKEERKAEKE